MAELSAKNQWDAGGPVIMVQIENGRSLTLSRDDKRRIRVDGRHLGQIEYFLDGQGTMDLDYIQALEREMIENGVTVPLSFNDVSSTIRYLVDTS